MSELVFRPSRRRRRVSLNLTSLIDVLFLLLIFFMLTSTFRQMGEMELQLPESSTSTPAQIGQEVRPTEVVLRSDGSLLLDGEPLDHEQLVQRLRAKVAEREDARVALNAEADARHADVVKLIDLVRELGFAGLSLGTELRPGAAQGGN